MRKAKFYLDIYKWPIILAFVAVSIFFDFNVVLNFQIIPDDFKQSYLVQTIATLLGVFIAFQLTESNKKVEQRKRAKKSLGILKLTVVEYLENHIKDIQTTLSIHNDICDKESANKFLVMVSNLDIFALTIHKDWFQIIHSQDFLDTIDHDNRFNNVSALTSEMVLHIRQLAVSSTNASSLLEGDFDEEKYMSRAKQIRNDLQMNLYTLSKCLAIFDTEVMNFLESTGAKYSEVKK